jgi:hypothetical protein
MKNIKKQLQLMFSIALCASFHAFTMEKERSNASGEWTDSIGDSSNESGISDPLITAKREQKNKQWLTEQIKILQEMNQELAKKLENDVWEMSIDVYTGMKKFQEDIQLIISTIEEMLSGDKPININSINQLMKIANLRYKLYLQ